MDYVTSYLLFDSISRGLLHDHQSAKALEEVSQDARLLLEQRLAMDPTDADLLLTKCKGMKGRIDSSSDGKGCVLLS